MIERIVAPLPDLADAFVRRLEEEARVAVSTRGHFSLAVPGGSVATAFFPRLNEAGIDWESTHVFQADERCVPPDHEDSNSALAKRLLPNARNFHRMRGEEPDLQRAAGTYGEELALTLGDPPVLDVALLGVGPDGHVASLFPGHSALDEDRCVAWIDDAPKPPPCRLTLTMPVLQRSRLIVIGAAGREKALAVRALEDPASRLPVALLVQAAAGCLLLLDPAAAGELAP